MGNNNSNTMEFIGAQQLFGY